MLHWFCKNPDCLKVNVDRLRDTLRDKTELTCEHCRTEHLILLELIDEKILDGPCKCGGRYEDGYCPQCYDIL